VVSSFFLRFLRSLGREVRNPLSLSFLSGAFTWWSRFPSKFDAPMNDMPKVSAPSPCIFHTLSSGVCSPPSPPPFCSETLSPFRTGKTLFFFPHLWAVSQWVSPKKSTPVTLAARPAMGFLFHPDDSSSFFPSYYRMAGSACRPQLTLRSARVAFPQTFSFFSSV